MGIAGADGVVGFMVAAVLLVCVVVYGLYRLFKFTRLRHEVKLHWLMKVAIGLTVCAALVIPFVLCAGLLDPDDANLTLLGWSFKEAGVWSIPALALELTVIAAAIVLMGIVYGRRWALSASIAVLGLLTAWGVFASCVSTGDTDAPISTAGDGNPYWVLPLLMLIYLVRNRADILPPHEPCTSSLREALKDCAPTKC